MWDMKIFRLRQTRQIFKVTSSITRGYESIHSKVTWPKSCIDRHLSLGTFPKTEDQMWNFSWHLTHHRSIRQISMQRRSYSNIKNQWIKIMMHLLHLFEWHDVCHRLKKGWETQIKNSLFRFENHDDSNGFFTHGVSSAHMLLCQKQSFDHCIRHDSWNHDWFPSITFRRIDVVVWFWWRLRNLSIHCRWCVVESQTSVK